MPNKNNTTQKTWESFDINSLPSDIPEDCNIYMPYGQFVEAMAKAKHSEREKLENKIIPILADIGYTLEVVEDAVVDQHTNTAQVHLIHVRKQLKAIAKKLVLSKPKHTQTEGESR